MKRQAFPRFYFLADDELLELLSRCRDTSAVQPHLRKCFDAVHSLDFGDGPGSNTINAMVSTIKPSRCAVFPSRSGCRGAVITFQRKIVKLPRWGAWFQHSTTHLAVRGRKFYCSNGLQVSPHDRRYRLFHGRRMCETVTSNPRTR